MGKRGPKPRPFEDQFVTGGGCWIWIGTFYTNGYGRFGRTTAHRRMFELVTGPVPADRVVMHSCDNRACVRPDHLSLGSPADNMADMVAKGRSLRGERNHQSKLRTPDIRSIRDQYRDGHTTAAIARAFSVSEALIYAVVRNQAWRWVA